MICNFLMLLCFGRLEESLTGGSGGAAGDAIEGGADQPCPGVCHHLPIWGKEFRCRAASLHLFPEQSTAKLSNYYFVGI